MKLRKMTSCILFVGLSTNLAFPTTAQAQCTGAVFGPSSSCSDDSGSTSTDGSKSSGKYDPYKDQLSKNTGSAFDGDLDKFAKAGGKLSGGPFLGDYNGLSFDIDPSEPTIKKDEGEKIEFELGVKIDSMLLMEKACEPTGSKMPGSVKDIFKTLKEYDENGDKREDIISARNEGMSVYMEKNLANKDAIFAQLIAIEYQIEMLNIQIDQLSGSTLFSKTSSDKKNTNSAYNSVATSALAWKEKLLLALTEAAAQSTEEAKESLEIGQACVKSYNAARSTIQKGCERTKEVESCNEDGECSIDIVPDPVPNSCELLPKIDEVAQTSFEEISKIYFSSEPLNSMGYSVLTIKQLEKIQEFYAGAPELEDGYAWKGEYATCVEPKLPKILKDNAVKCILDSTTYEGATPAQAKEVVSKQALHTKALNDHVSGMGSTPKFKESMTKLFQGQIADIDGKIGNPFLRAEVFDEIMTPLQESISYDRQRLSVYIDTRAKLIKYFENLYKLYTENDKEKEKKEQEKKAQDSKANAGSGNKPTQSAPSASGGVASQDNKNGSASNFSLSGSGGVVNYDQANSAVTGEGKVLDNETFKSQLEALKSASNVDASTEIKNLLSDINSASNTRISTKSLNSNGSIGSSSAVGNKFAYSNKESQKRADKLVTKTKKAEALVTKTDAKATNTAAKEVKNSYLGLTDKKKSKALYAAIDPAIIKAFNTASEKPAGPATARLTGASSTPLSSSYSGSAYTGNFGSGSSSRGSSSSSSYSSPSTNNKSYQNNSFNESVSSQGSLSAANLTEDQREIRKAIQESKKNEAKYQTTEGDSIFEVLTKAHIRNYKKIAD